MSATKSGSEIVNLSYNQLEEATEVLAEAFRHDPLMQYLMSHLGEDYSRCLQEFFRFPCEIRLDLNWPLLGVTSDKRLQWVAGLSLPEEKPWPASLQEKHRQLAELMGTRGSERLEHYGSIVGENITRQTHIFLGAPGVHPRAQGQGLSRALLDHIHAMSEAHPTSTGVALDTDTAVNVSLYQHFGYEVNYQTTLEELDVWCMFRPNGAAGGDAS
jgi:GNAT superfamily N-acetyltransferase